MAEGVRIQKVPGNEEQLVADALANAGLRPPERFVTRYPLRALGGPAPARGHRGGHGPQS